ncbi:MAG: AAA family ATPase [Clostridia bacterium]
MKNYKLVIGRKNLEKLDMSTLNVVPASLSPYLIDLNPFVANSDSLSAIKGRDKEINRIYNCLLSGMKSKVVLLGKHGVGKTAIIQKLMYNVVVRKQCPKKLRDVHFLYLDVDLLVNEIVTRKSTKKLEKIIKFILKHSGIVLYIDDIHLVETTYVMSYYFSLLVKYPDIKIIGASTEEEYFEYFQIDFNVLKKITSELLNIFSEKKVVLIVDSIHLYFNITNSFDKPDSFNQLINYTDRFVSILMEKDNVYIIGIRNR